MARAIVDHGRVLADSRRTLEAVFGKLGLDPASLLLTAADDRVVYKMRRGSVDVVAALSTGGRDGRAYVRVVAPVMVPPSEATRRAALLERLLELNAHGMQNAAFGLAEGQVIAVSERPVTGLDQVLSAVADTFDDKLVAEFGGRRASDG